MNLTWDGPKTYDPPPADTLFVEDLGISDTVHIMPGPVPFSVARNALNTESSAIGAGYPVRERIIRWVFQAVAGSAGWVRGDTLTHVVYTETVQGPGLAGMTAAPVVFDSIPALPCGLYEEELILDLDDSENETDETDNTARHFFFVPSPQTFNIVLDTLDNELFHADGRTATYVFNVVPNPGATGTPVANIVHFSFVATDGSTADVLPAPVVPVPAAGASVTMFVTPNEHDPSVPPPSPQVTGKLTVLSADGCVLRQMSAAVLIEHG